ncbi:Transposase-like protein [Mycena venus]|uniref:Transposase-like protein n=1 Tax=Mycena venus TaxID=2733690 RepID=A0A8H7DE43_9AGAR|nr:Transposase-like protein [Mycena venus]
MPQNIVSYDHRPSGKLLPARGTLFLSRPEAIGAHAQKSIILNFLLFMLPFVALGLGIFTLGDRLGIYTHEFPFDLWYTLIYFAFCEGLSLLSIGWVLFPQIFRFHQFVPLILGVRRHRSHFSFMSQRRRNQVLRKSKPIFTIFVMGFRSRSLPIPVTGDTTVAGISQYLDSSLGLDLTHYYFTYLGRRMDWGDRMESLGIGALSHLQLRLRVLGGAKPGSAPQASTSQASTSRASTSRPERSANRTRMTDAIADDLAVPSSPKKRRRRLKPKPKPQNSDPEDSDFSSSDSSGESDSGIEEIIPNEELASTLPTKTVPEKSKRKVAERPQKKKRKTKHKTDDNDAVPASEPDDNPDATVPEAHSSGSVRKPKAKSGMGAGKRSNPIYLFYESVTCDAKGTLTKGSNYWKSYFGSREIIEITQGANCNTRKLQKHLKATSLPHYQLFQVLLARSSPPTDRERALACGATELTDDIVAEYVEIGKRLDQNIKAMFEKQVAEAQVPWNQEHFETLVANHESVKERIMKMSEEMVKELKAIFKENKSNFVLSLDAWTSSNGYAFLAIVIHYIGNDGKLEECLIDFRELVGQHSGENMAAAVWATVEKFGLIGRITAIVMDNATNNDTMVEAFARRCRKEGINFSIADGRMRCMPHTIHLSALKLLEAIGALTKDEKKAAKSKSATSAHQDSATESLSREADEEAGQTEDSEDIEVASPESLVGTAVYKLRKIIRHVRSIHSHVDFGRQNTMVFYSSNASSRFGLPETYTQLHFGL